MGKKIVAMILCTALLGGCGVMNNLDGTTNRGKATGSSSTTSGSSSAAASTTYKLSAYSAVTGATSSGACSTDIQNDCANAGTTPGAIYECLEKYLNTLSSDCENEVNKITAAITAIAAACTAEINKDCVGVAADAQPFCLKDHQSDLGVTCANALDANKPTNPQGPPPQAALDACSTKASGDSCSFTSPQGTTLSGSCFQPSSQAPLACKPTK